MPMNIEQAIAEVKKHEKLASFANVGEHFVSLEAAQALLSRNEELEQEVADHKESLAMELAENLELFGMLGLTTEEDFGHETSTAAIVRKVQALLSDRERLMTIVLHNAEKRGDLDINDSLGMSRNANGSWHVYFDAVEINYAAGREIVAYPTAMEALTAALSQQEVSDGK